MMTIDTAQYSDVRAEDAQTRTTGRTRLDRARQTRGHNLDPCCRGGETPVPNKARGPRRHARPAFPGPVADPARGRHEDRPPRHGGAQERLLYRALGGGAP